MKKFLIMFLLMGSLLYAAPLPGQTATVTLAWDANDPSEQVSKYSVYQATAASGPWAKVQDVLAPVTTATMSGLAPGIYYFYVTASNQWQESGPSNVVNTAPPATPPKNVTVTVTVQVSVP